MRKYLFLIGLTLSHAAFSSGYLVPLGDGVKIQKVLMHNQEGATFFVSGLANPDGCNDTNLVHLKADTIGYEGMLSAALTAYASGKKLDFGAVPGVKLCRFGAVP